nr:MAG TPA: hypothetical protein [Caudoviricetes sp.]
MRFKLISDWSSYVIPYSFPSTQVSGWVARYSANSFLFSSCLSYFA